MNSSLPKPVEHPAPPTMPSYYDPPLPLGSIRLLRLLPSLNEGSSIESTLSTYCLLDSSSTHPFEALSYVWGSRENLQRILVNGFECEIGENLHAALLRLRDRFIERVIWIDAICINQEDTTEKGSQVQSMAKIYAKASRVLVWLGAATATSKQALDHIRRAGRQRAATKASTQTTEQDTQASEQAVVNLLERPWFQRIWVLQEVAAARHILIMCGPTMIDGYAFCAGVNALELSYQKYPHLQGLIPPIIYLVQDAVFRPRDEGNNKTDPQERFSLQIRPLGELIDMYHTHKATVCFDKVYALLGMCDDNPYAAGLDANYEAAWGDVLQTLVRFCLSENISVGTGDGAEATMVIEAKGHILGEVSSAGEDINRDQGQSNGATQHDNQQVRITWKDAPSHFGEKETTFTFHASAKAVRKGDVICLLHGARTPTIIRLRGHVSTIIRIAVPPSDDLKKRVDSVTAFLDNLLLLWDWNTSQSKWHSGGEYWSLISRRRVPTCSIAACQCLYNLDKAARLWNIGRLLARIARCEEAVRNFQSAMESYKAGMTARSVDNTCLGHGLCREVDEDTLAIMGTQVIDDSTYSMVKKRNQRKRIRSWATLNGYEVVVRLLVDNDVNIKVMGSLRQALLWWAAKNGHETVLWLLLEKGANIEAVDDSYKKRTLLWLAAKSGHEAVVRLLVDKGADIEASDNNGRTPLWLAVKNGYEAVRWLLVNKGANIEAEDNNWGRPL
ncbi:heterokaryon incompatibility protein-domain-containing protein [Cladorrhinum sp. PSN259]|nr:heterokaryon incompatibility protein-domain-containing protein [Cladorrhinum sp. PSN259]